MTYNGYSTKYSHWIDLRVQANRQHTTRDRGVIEKKLNEYDTYLKSPQKIRFIPSGTHKTTGMLYTTYFNVARKNINTSFDSLKNRIGRNIDHNVAQNVITQSEGNVLKRDAFSRIENERSSYLNPFNALDKRAQNIYNQSIKNLESWGKTGKTPEIERAIGYKYLPTKYQKKAKQVQSKVEAGMIERKVHAKAAIESVIRASKVGGKKKTIESVLRATSADTRAKAIRQLRGMPGYEREAERLAKIFSVNLQIEAPLARPTPIRVAISPTKRIDGHTYQLQSPRRGTTNGRVATLRERLRQQGHRSVRVVRDGRGRKFVYAIKR